MDEEKQNNKLIRYILIGLTAYIFLVVLSYILNFNHLNISKNDPSEWGAFGDYIGGLLNPTLAFLSFIGVLWTLKMSREELVETRKVMSEQLKTQSLQKFDSLFFSLLNQFSINVRELKIDFNKSLDETYNNVFHNPRICTSFSRRQEIIKNRELSNLYIFLFQILKSIDLKLQDNAIKKEYSNIIRSLIPSDVLHLLLVNCDIDDHHDFIKLKNKLEDFSFFEHISFFNQDVALSNILLITSNNYDSKSFGNNTDYLNFKNSCVSDSFKERFGVQSILTEALQNTENCKYAELPINHLKFTLYNGGTIIHFKTDVEYSFLHAEILLGQNTEVTDFRVVGGVIYLKTNSWYSFKLGVNNDQELYITHTAHPAVIAQDI